ncbi:ATP-dependent DNA helicase PIF1-like protein [Tanacetum coccineum]
MRGRMVLADPTKGEQFYLRLLLQHVKGPTSILSQEMFGSTITNHFQKCTTYIMQVCRKLHEECLIVVQDEDILTRHSLYTDKKIAYDSIMRHVDADSPGMFFIDGPEGTGKTFMYKALLPTIRSRGLMHLPPLCQGLRKIT